MLPTRQDTSIPSTSASISCRPVPPWCSASASAADATGPAGWMIVLRCVSSKSNVCDEMPLSNAALAMSTRSPRPRIVACAAGANSCTAASAAASVGCCAAPTAQPTQLSRVRCASRSTASLQPRDGWPTANSARMRVTGGAWASAMTTVFCAMSVDDLDLAILRELRPLRDVVAHVLAELRGRHRHRFQRLARQSFAQLRIGEHFVDLGIERGHDCRWQVGGTDDAVPLHAVGALV